MTRAEPHSHSHSHSQHELNAKVHRDSPPAVVSAGAKQGRCLFPGGTTLHPSPPSACPLRASFSSIPHHETGH